MARIRTIKPEFPQSESMGNVSREARLCFILLWTVADDEGRLRGNSRMLASLLFPYDDDARSLIDSWLSELDHENCLRQYAVDGHSYLQILNWLNHQKIDKPSKSKFPPFDESSRILANPRESSSEYLRKGSEDQGYGPKELPLLSPEPATTEPKIRPEEFANSWNRLRKGLPRVDQFSDSRRKKVQARIRQGVTLERFEKAVECCTVKPFLRGENDRGWTATFDFLIENDRNIEKVINEAYGLNKTNGGSNGKSSSKQNATVDAVNQMLARIRGVDHEGVGEDRRADGGAGERGALVIDAARIV